MSDLAAGLDKSILALVDDVVGSSLVLEPNNSRRLLLNSEDAGNDRKRGSDKGKKSHDDSGIGDDKIDEELWMMKVLIVATKVRLVLTA